MKRIYKYPLPAGRLYTNDLRMPAGARILSVQVQHQVVCLWAVVDPEAEVTTRRLLVRDTGDSCEGLSETFIGTFQLEGGNTVGHVFDAGEVRS